MKVVSIDIETTSLDETTGKVLSIGAVIEDTTNLLPLKHLPKFHCIILHKEITGQPYALNMNRDLISAINEYQTSKDKKAVELKHKSLFRGEEEAIIELYKFLAVYLGIYSQEEVDGGFTGASTFIFDNPPVRDQIKFIVAGKNFNAFDRKWLERLPGWNDLFKIHRRVIDPVPLFTDWVNDEIPPSLEECKRRAGLEDSTVTHNAVDDALDIIKLLRTQYGKENI